MRILSAFFLLAFFASCASEPQTAVVHDDGIDTVLRLPSITNGMVVDSALSSIRINAVTDSSGQIIDLWTEESGELTNTVNIYADAQIGSSLIDSVINFRCSGKDLCLVGVNNGIELAIPFHALHRFNAHTDTFGVNDHSYHLVFVSDTDITVNDWPAGYATSEDYFRTFYGDAFNPVDSSFRFPQRKPHRQTVEGLMLEGQAWDETDLKNAADTAQMLAAYNGFVNKLEIYDKAGSFCLLPLAVMEMDPAQVSWGRLMQVFGEHYTVVASLCESAKRYLADKIANDGGDPGKVFTDEDLRLLYPDRLRWNGRISGTHEHYYDPELLAPWRWVAPVPPVKPAPERVRGDI
jgi:hypothetical protein